MIKFGRVTSINKENGNVAVTFFDMDSNTTDYIPKLSSCCDITINDRVVVGFDENSKNMVVLGKLEGE